MQVWKKSACAARTRSVGKQRPRRDRSSAARVEGGDDVPIVLSCTCTRSTMTRPPTERRLCTTLHRCECVDTSSTRRAAPSGGRLHNELPLQRGWPARKSWTEIVSGRFRLPNAAQSWFTSLHFTTHRRVFQDEHANTHLGRARAEPRQPGAHAHASYAWPYSCTNRRSA